MLHSVIIPCRGYERYLPFCYWALWRSAELCRQSKNLEIIVVREGADSQCPTPPCGNVVTVEQQGRYFNKPRLQNIGIESSHGEILTFLDADSIVGPRFADTARIVVDLNLLPKGEVDHLTKLCYRVRYLPPAALQMLADCTTERTKQDLVNKWLTKWHSFDQAFEGYGSAEPWDTKVRGPQPTEPVFGNSQFSIRRDVLGGMRFDEQYVGRGYEDIEMNRRIWRHYGDQYKAVIMTDAYDGILQIRNPYQGELWGAGEQNSRNAERYART